MEDELFPQDSPRSLSETLRDPSDPLTPDIEEEDRIPRRPVSDHHADQEVIGENEVDKDDTSDLESELSEVDERQFEDFDPTAIAIEDRPAIAVDETTIGQLGKHKRKRADGDDDDRKKKKERRREKPKKNRRKKAGSEEFEGGPEIDGKRVRKKRDGERGNVRDGPTDFDLESLTPQERRRRALDAAMDAALRNPNARRRKADGIDLDALADEQIETMRRRMTDAAMADNDARAKGEPAMAKMKLMPDVNRLLNRSSLANSLVDPDINLLEAVRFFLEPLNDGSLPAYQIQRDLFNALGKLPINKDSLVASGIGKVALFYTRSKRPEDSIKRQAEKLLSDWMRPILKRSDDYRKRELTEATYDPVALAARQSTHKEKERQRQKVQNELTDTLTLRDRALATPTGGSNRARVEGGVGAYTIVPKSNVTNPLPMTKMPGQSGEEAFRRLKMRQQGKMGGNRRGCKPKLKMKLQRDMD